ncbi:MAG: type I pullulanase [Ruminococcus sp.]|nr:type I pullulanase [Ruminococcus sp.]
MKFKRLVSLVLTVLMIAGISTISLTANAAETEIADTGAKLGNYYNVDYLETQAQAYLKTQADKSKTDLGANYTPEQTTWNVWSPNATRVQLKLYATGSDMESGAANLGKYDMNYNSTTGVWSYTLKGDQKNVYYTYIVTTSAGTKETYDIYAKAAGVNGDRSMVVDLDSTDPDGWDKDEHVFLENQTDAILWEVHIADLTSSDTSGVDDNYQGKFLGFMEGGLTINGEDGAKRVGIDYLVEQGINAVHIQCPFDFASGDETNPESYNWGYDPKNYNLPEGMYATNPYDGNVRINEFKQLIQALHDRGIAVIMGVVYNHTYVTEQSAFTYTCPGYYYRMSSSTFYINGTGCGNTLASDKAMFNSYMLNSLRYWVEEYHIDGFRFDLAAAHDIVTMNEIRTMFNNMYDGEGKKIIMYGEPWGVGDCGLSAGNAMETPYFAKLSSNIAGFNSYTRQAMHGSEAGTMKGWLSGAATKAYANTLKRGVLGKFSSDGYTKYPNQSVNYVDCHDGVTWWDNIVMSNKAASSSNKAGFDTTDAKYRAMLRTTFTYLFTTQGLPFTLAGTEFARTKYGNGNSYNAGATNAFDWTRIETYATEVAYAKGMRQIRAAFSPFRNSETYNNPTWLTTSNENGILAYSLSNNKAGEWSSVIVAVNNGAAGTVTLPAGTWTIVADGEKAGLTSLGTASGTYNIAANSSAVLVQGTTTAVAPEYETITVNHYVGDELIKSSEAIYEVGTTWRATPDVYTLFDHNITKIEKTAGTQDDNCVYGTVEKGQNVEVNFYYEQFSTSGYLTIKYVDESGESIVSDVNYRMLDGTEFNVPFENKAGFELISDKYPSNFKGTFDADNPATITFVYKALASDKITVYYYNALGSGTLRMYAYTEEEEKPLGAWDNSLQNMEKVTDASELPEGEVVGNWYKKTIDESNNQLDYFPASCKIMFLLSGQGKQEPLNGEAGYDAAGTIYIKNKIVTFDAKVITSHLDAETGEKLADDVVTNHDGVTSNDIYVTSANNNLGASIAPANASGNLVAGSTCVVYMYTGEPVTDPSIPVGEGVLLGDADLDQTITIKDATLIQKYTAKLETLEGDALLAADADKSEQVNIKDATVIQKYVAGIKVDTPVGEAIPGTGPSDTNLKDQLIELYNTASTLIKDKADWVTEAALKADSDEMAAKAEFGYDISAEDTTKNEYKKFEAVIGSAGYFVVQGGTDEEIENALASLEQAYEWFSYYVTELHTEPVTTVAGSRTVYFSNNKGWSTVYAYCWNSASNENNNSWPGLPMTYVETNDMGEQIYSYDIPEGMNWIIFNNGNQGQQTVDLSLDTYTQNGFYISGGSGTTQTVEQYTR